MTAIKKNLEDNCFINSLKKWDNIQTMTQQDNNNKLIEEALLKEADRLTEKAGSQGEKALYNQFKSAILKKYKDRYDVDFQQGEVKKELVDKSIDFLFEDTCVRFRSLPNVDDSIKEEVTKRAKVALPSWKDMIVRMLKERGIKVL